MRFVMSQNCEMQVGNGTESNGLTRIFANYKGNLEKGLGHLFITSSSSHFFDKTDFELLNKTRSPSEGCPINKKLHYKKNENFNSHLASNGSRRPSREKMSLLGGVKIFLSGDMQRITILKRLVE